MFVAFVDKRKIDERLFLVIGMLYFCMYLIYLQDDLRVAVKSPQQKEEPEMKKDEEYTMRLFFPGSKQRNSLLVVTHEKCRMHAHRTIRLKDGQVESGMIN
ncbi:hypothetical protein [Mangrovibacterium marinum]|uniref:Uncharacterized protein n=1 Tax=Mangrovibacterium marinum TaxID=1639118 RepID=A0A2T5BY36_9BACT|nr:hypothetical protein [Mangrovibacterium marinum]PTN06339.1 hypothetical protein C8N47_12221 [Mangrovibacterium marinum]